MIDFILNREFNPKCIALSGLAVALYCTLCSCIFRGPLLRWRAMVFVIRFCRGTP